MASGAVGRRPETEQDWFTDARRRRLTSHAGECGLYSLTSEESSKVSQQWNVVRFFSDG